METEWFSYRPRVRYLVSSTLNNGDKVTVVLISNAICPAPANAPGNEITMTVNDNVVPSVTISANTSAICMGDQIEFTAEDPTEGGLNPAFQWQISNDNGNSFTDIDGATSQVYSGTVNNNNDIIRLQLTSSASLCHPKPGLQQRNSGNSHHSSISCHCGRRPGIMFCRHNTCSKCPCHRYRCLVSNFRRRREYQRPGRPFIILHRC